MLRHIWVEQTLFSPFSDKGEDETDLLWMLEALTQRNQNYLKQHPRTPRLYKSGVKYAVPAQYGGECKEVAILKQALGGAANKRDVRKVLELIQDVLGGEHFCDIGVILELGEIDCDGLAAFRAAELRQAGIRAKPWMTKRTRPDGGTTYHALVKWPPFGRNQHETSEDPSLLLGMGGPARAKDRQEEIRKNIERCEDIKSGLGGLGVSPEQQLAEVLGLRRQRQAGRPQLALEHLLRRRAA